MFFQTLVCMYTIMHTLYTLPVDEECKFETLFYEYSRLLRDIFF